jgi:hypothetical protein
LQDHHHRNLILKALGLWILIGFLKKRRLTFLDDQDRKIKEKANASNVKGQDTWLKIVMPKQMCKLAPLSMLLQEEQINLNVLTNLEEVTKEKDDPKEKENTYEVQK